MDKCYSKKSNLMNSKKKVLGFFTLGNTINARAKKNPTTRPAKRLTAPGGHSRSTKTANKGFKSKQVHGKFMIK